VTGPDYSKILAFIDGCSDPSKLKSLIINAKNRGAEDIEEAARRRLYKVQSGLQPGTLSFDVWQSIHALEDALSSEAGATRRLSRTRQKIQRVGEERTVMDLVESTKPSSGYRMLLDRSWPELTFEALALKHGLGSAEASARERLGADGIDVEGLIARMRNS
jgi:hypothetical protein